MLGILLKSFGPKALIIASWNSCLPRKATKKKIRSTRTHTCVDLKKNKTIQSEQVKSITSYLRFVFRKHCIAFKCNIHRRVSAILMLPIYIIMEKRIGRQKKRRKSRRATKQEQNESAKKRINAEFAQYLANEM